MQFINYKYVINSEFSSSRSESLFKVYAIGHFVVLGERNENLSKKAKRVVEKVIINKGKTFLNATTTKQLDILNELCLVYNVDFSFNDFIIKECQIDKMQKSKAGESKANIKRK